MRRRDFFKASAAVAAGSVFIPRRTMADVLDHIWEGYNFGSVPVTNRLDQGPFPDTQEGSAVIFATTPSRGHVRNFGTGLVGYTWEENGPALAVQCGRKTLEQSVEAIASLPYVDVLYIRCDWRDVQSVPGKLQMSPVWEATFDAAKRHNLGVGFRVQLSSPNIQPQKLSMPDFLREKVPVVHIGKSKLPGYELDFYEPRYDSPEFQRAFTELNELLAERYDSDPHLEYMDLMMYGLWGEGHSLDLPNPFPDYLTAEQTLVRMTQLQIDTWKKTPLVVNTQTDISKVGNRQVQDLAVRSGCWVRADDLIMNEPLVSEELAHRPPWLATVLEEGSSRHYLLREHAGIEQACLKKLPSNTVRMSGLEIEVKTGDDWYSRTAGNPMDRPFRDSAGFHALDVGANYFGLWTEADNVRAFYEKYPDSLRALEQRLGYRVRPSLIWQRKRYDTTELILAIVNDGVAGVPGVLGIYVEALDRRIKVGGNLDAGQPFAGNLRQVSILLPKGLAGQQVILRAELEVRGVRRPVRWACHEKTNQDGSLTIRLNDGA